MANRTSEELLEDILRALQRPPGGGSGGNGGGVAGLALDDFTSALSSPKGAIKTVGKLAKHAGKAGPALTAVAIAAEKLYDYMNESLTQFKALNASGLQTTGGMLGLNKALASGQLSFQEFQNAVRDNTDVLASMGSDGAQRLGDFNKALINTEKTSDMLALSNEQAASYIIDNIKQQKAYNIFDKMTRTEQEYSNQKYVKDLNDYSKSLGISTDALSKKLNKSAESVVGLGTEMSLVKSGLSEADAAKTSKNVNMVMASFGNLGDEVNAQFARMLAFGGQYNTDSFMGQITQISPKLQQAFDAAAELARSGDLATDAGQKQLQKILSDKSMISELRDSIDIFRGTFGDEAGDALTRMVQKLQNYDPDAVKLGDSLWDGMTNELNRWFDANWFATKEQIALLFTHPKEFFKNLDEAFIKGLEDLGSWMGIAMYDLVHGGFETFRQEFGGWLGTAIYDLFHDNRLTRFGEKLGAAAYDFDQYMSNAIHNIKWEDISSMINKTIYGLIGWVTKSFNDVNWSDVGAAVSKSIGDLFTMITDGFGKLISDSIGSFDISSSMINPANWWGSDDKVAVAAPTTPTVATTKVSKPQFTSVTPSPLASSASASTPYVSPQTALQNNDNMLNAILGAITQTNNINEKLLRQNSVLIRSVRDDQIN